MRGDPSRRMLYFLADRFARGSGLGVRRVAGKGTFTEIQSLVNHSLLAAVAG